MSLVALERSGALKPGNSDRDRELAQTWRGQGEEGKGSVRSSLSGNGDFKKSSMGVSFILHAIVLGFH